MTPKNIQDIQSIIDQFTQINHTVWMGVLCTWIGNSDFFMAQTEFDDSSDADYLITKTKKSLSKLRSNSTDEDLIETLSHEFEANYFQAQFPNQPRWDFRNESFLAFCWRHRVRDSHQALYPNLLLVEEATVKPSDIKAWLNSFFSKASI